MTFGLKSKIIFWHSNPILTFKLRQNIIFWILKYYFDIQTEAEYRILTFLILFWHSNWGRISNFDIRNPILTLKDENRILTFELMPNIVFWRSKSYFHIKLKPNIVFWHSKPYFDFQTEAEYRILTFEILFWHSNWSRISYFDIQNPILTFKLMPNIVIWHSKSYFDKLRLNIVFWNSKF